MDETGESSLNKNPEELIGWVHRIFEWSYMLGCESSGARPEEKYSSVANE